MGALYNSLDFLIHPTFWDPKNPPVKINVNAKTVGLVSAILGAFIALFTFAAILTLLTFSAVVVGAVGANTGLGTVAVIGVIFLVLSLVTDLMWVYGGYRMYQEDERGRSMVVAALSLSFVFTVLGHVLGANVSGIVVSLIVDGAIYYVVMVAHFPHEETVAAAPSAPPPAPPMDPS